MTEVGERRGAFRRPAMGRSRPILPSREGSKFGESRRTRGSFASSRLIQTSSAVLAGRGLRAGLGASAAGLVTVWPGLRPRPIDFAIVRRASE